MKWTVGGVVATCLALVVAAVCVRLGFWQLDRLEQRRATNAALAAALSLPVLELRGDSLAAVARAPAAYRFRRVRLTGEYHPPGEVVLRGRALEGRPGVHLVTPLRVGQTDTAVLVDRGWVAAPDAATVDPRRHAEPGARTVEGVLQLVPESSVGGIPHTRTTDGVQVTSMQRIDLAVLRARVPLTLVGAYVQQLPSPSDPQGAPTRVAIPPLSEGPHFGYALQWFGFAATAVIGLLVMLWRSSRGVR